jgi:hypothetical protein
MRPARVGKEIAGCFQGMPEEFLLGFLGGFLLLPFS